MIMDINELRDTLLEATLPNVLFDGWTDHALRTGAQAAGLGPEMVLHAFPEGAHDLAAHLSAWADAGMVEAYRAEDTEGLRLAQRVALAVRLRIEVLGSHREAVRSWLGWLALPAHAALAARLLYRTIDEIWYTVGDGSTDFSFYTKRALLAGVYSATLLHWLGNEAEDQAASWVFLDEALHATTSFGRSVRRLGDFSKVLTYLPSPARFVRQVRRRTAI